MNKEYKQSIYMIYLFSRKYVVLYKIINTTIETTHLHFVFMFWLVWHILLPYTQHLVCFQAQRSLVVAPVVANGALQEKVVSSFIIFASLLLLLQDCKSLKENK